MAFITLALVVMFSSNSLRVFISSAEQSFECDVYYAESYAMKSSVSHWWFVIVSILIGSMIYNGIGSDVDMSILFLSMAIFMAIPLACLAEFDMRYHLIVDSWLALMAVISLFIILVRYASGISTIESIVYYQIAPFGSLMLMLFAKRLLKLRIGIGDGDLKMIAVMLLSLNITYAMNAILAGFILAAAAFYIRKVHFKLNEKHIPLAPFFSMAWAAVMPFSFH